MFSSSAPELVNRAKGSSNFDLGYAESQTAEITPLSVEPRPVDRTLVCFTCGAEFVFTAGEQSFFRTRNFINDPKRCKLCRSGRRTGTRTSILEIRVNCSSCGVSTTVPFRPRQGRPVLCRDCFESTRRPA